MSETARHHSIIALKPDDRHLADFRRDVLILLSDKLCAGYQQRLLFSVNEIVANLMRHADPKPTEVRIDFEDVGGTTCCVIRDNGGSFVTFPKIWESICTKTDVPMFANGHVGLSLVQSFCPTATYTPKNARQKYNQFVLPLVVPTDDNVPEFFRVKKGEVIKRNFKEKGKDHDRKK